MTPTERAAFAAELATLSGDALETLLSQGTLFSDPERYWMIKAEADKVWGEYQAELAAMGTHQERIGDDDHTTS